MDFLFVNLSKKQNSRAKFIAFQKHLTWIFMSEWYDAKPVTCSKGLKVPFAVTGHIYFNFV